MNFTTEQRDIQHAVLLSRKDQILDEEKKHQNNLREIKEQEQALTKRKREEEEYIKNCKSKIADINKLISPYKTKDHEVKCFTCGSLCPLTKSGQYYVCPNYSFEKSDDARHFLRKVSRN